MQCISFALLLCSLFFLLDVHAVKIDESRDNPVKLDLHTLATSRRYLVASFPDIKAVAYTHLPDTIWRPLYIGKVARPVGVAADVRHNRLFVADHGLKRIFWYKLTTDEKGLLKTDGRQHVAVDGVTANYLSVDGVGNLYFSGQLHSNTTSTASRSIFRMAENRIAEGNAINPVDVYTRANTGYPTSRLWMPTGLAVDSFGVYWGNQEKGKSHGSLCSGSRQSVDVTTDSNPEVSVLNQAVEEVRGVADAAGNVFFLSPEGVFGASKTAKDGAAGAVTSRIQSVPQGGDPQSMAFDGESTMFWTDAKAGIVYKFPAMDTNKHPLSKYIDAPLVHGVAVYSVIADGSSLLSSATSALQNVRKHGLQHSARAVESRAGSGLNLHALSILGVALPFLISIGA